MTSQKVKTAAMRGSQNVFISIAIEVADNDKICGFGQIDESNDRVEGDRHPARLHRLVYGRRTWSKGVNIPRIDGYYPVAIGGIAHKQIRNTIAIKVIGCKGKRLDRTGMKCGSSHRVSPIRGRQF